MPVLQELNSQQIDEAVGGATKKNVPLTITVRSGQKWTNLHSRAVALEDKHICIEPPKADYAMTPHDFTPAQKVGLSFKLKHYKHICSATVVGPTNLRQDGGTIVPVLSLCWPLHMQRLQRRAYRRVDVPPGKIVRASFWLGGQVAEPQGTSVERPVWSGQVANISAGGFQLAMGEDLTDLLEVGETAGVRMVFGLGEQTVYCDAQLRHVAIEHGQCQIGFQFAGLALTAQGREALSLITERVTEYQRFAERRAETAWAARQ